MSEHRRARRGHILRILRLRRLFMERKKQKARHGRGVSEYVEIRRISHKASSRASSVHR